MVKSTDASLISDWYGSNMFMLNEQHVGIFVDDPKSGHATGAPPTIENLMVAAQYANTPLEQTKWSICPRTITLVVFDDAAATVLRVANT